MVFLYANYVPCEKQREKSTERKTKCWRDREVEKIIECIENFVRSAMNMVFIRTFT